MDELQPTDKQDEKQSSLAAEAKSIVFVIFIALLIRTFVIELFYVPTCSMKQTVLVGDYVLATKYSYGWSNYSIPFSPNLIEDRLFSSLPERGDVVITKSAHDMSTRFIKRLIGLPGDKIHIIDDVTYVNNEPITRTEIGAFTDEEGKEYIKYRETMPNGTTYYVYKLKYIKELHADEFSNYGPYYVPDGHFFLMGDNRDESGDSRAQVGFVPFRYLIGKGRFIIFSTGEFLWKDGIGVWNQIKRVGTWVANMRFNRIGTSLYLDSPKESHPKQDEVVNNEIEQAAARG